MRSELSLSDEWETPKKLFDWLCLKYNFFPSLDVCATEKNKKCDCWIGPDSPRQGNGLDGYWDRKNWMNCPHSETELWVKAACKFFLNEPKTETMAIIPANSMCTSYAEACIEPHAEYHPIFERPKFQINKEEKDVARNSYFVVIWRKK